jgi:hypothetical protein
LRQQIQDRFNDLDVYAAEIRFFQHPVDCDLEELGPELGNL